MGDVEGDFEMEDELTRASEPTYLRPKTPHSAGKLSTTIPGVIVQNGSSISTLHASADEESDDPLAALKADEEAVDIATPDYYISEPQRQKRALDLIEDLRVTSQKRNLLALPKSSRRTGLVYDVRMRFHATPDVDDHHPEDPRRIHEIFELLRATGLVDMSELTSSSSLRHATNFLLRINTREATMEEICRVHTKQHFDYLHDTSNKPLEELCNMSESGESVYFNKSTFYCAKLSAGGVIASCEAVLSGKCKNAIAIVRPPGHHAEPTKAQGFCFFNNVSIAARHCQARYPEQCRKVLIFDWDVHHGDGTQATFWEDPNVLLISMHVHENGTFYPTGPGGNHLRCGAGLGLGRNVNIPWSKQGMTDLDYLHAFRTLVMPIASEFDPDLVLISAGFDAADGDELGGCHVSPSGYAQMTHGMMSLANGNVVVCLEGGYDLHAISISALEVVRTLMGEPCDRVEPGPISKSASADMKLVRRAQTKYWTCMADDYADAVEVMEGTGQRMHDVIRLFQSYDLYADFKMIRLSIFRQAVSRTFQNEVLATGNYSTAKTLLVIFHDPPEMMGLPDPATQKLDLARTWMADQTKNYISWAVGRDYGVIDVNIPKYLTDLDEEAVGLAEEPRSYAHTREMIKYLWINYIELSAHKNLFLMGVGNAHYAAVHFLNACECQATRRGVVNFIHGSTIRSVRKESEERIAHWYKANSLIFVNLSHPVFDPERAAPKRKFGALHRSSSDDLSQMLQTHHAQATKWIESIVEEAESSADLDFGDSVIDSRGDAVMEF